jgi:hypothetical protein
MGYDLKNDRGEELRFSNSGWSLALEIAERHGWNPQGTLAPADWEEGKEWEGDYDTMDGQRVSAEDAAGLVKALERALADNHFAAKARDTFNELHDQIGGEHPPPGRVEFTLEVAEGFRATLRELIEFTGDCGFRID